MTFFEIVGMITVGIIVMIILVILGFFVLTSLSDEIIMGKERKIRKLRKKNKTLCLHLKNLGSRYDDLRRTNLALHNVPERTDGL